MPLLLIQEQLELKALADRKLNHHLRMLTRILAGEERRRGLLSDYDEIVAG